MLLDYDEFQSPIGRILFVSHSDGICALGFDGYEKEIEAIFERRFGAFEFRRGSDPHGLKARLRKYFDGDLRVLDPVLVSAGGTPFQQRVWKELRAIPAGETRSYGGLAKKLGKPQAARAVGHANAVNPVSIIVPCHRVIGTTSLTGYGGGLERKAWLLRHEGAQLALAAWG
jgi:O-6-methylguanine DNA methyltransferase